MSDEPVERMNYFQFQHLGAEDMAVQQAYHRDKLRRHNLGPHSWGVVQGCELVETEREGDPGFVDILVSPGLAVDAFGREITLLEPVRLEPVLFAAYASERIMEVWLHYDEYAQRTDSDAQARCINDAAFSRLIESHRLLIGPLSAPPDALVVGGAEAKPALADGSADEGAPIEPADRSIAAQDFPNVERNAFAPVRLGSVRWDGTVGKFRGVASPDILVQDRRYAGFIGAYMLAEGQALRIAPRVPVLMADRDNNDFVGIEGRLSVDGRVVARRDVLLHGGMVSFQATGGVEEGVPLWIRRIPGGVSNAGDLRIHIGDSSSNAAARLTIGPGAPPHAKSDEKVVLAVRADDKIDVPTGQLRFAGTGRQAIHLALPSESSAASAVGVGWQAQNLYQRAGNNQYWYRGGEHHADAGNPGTGGELLMRLDSSGRLHWPGDYRQAINFSMNGQDFGIGAQTNTLYARSAANFAWYRGGGHDDASLSSGGGTRAMWLDTSSRLTVEGGVRSKGPIEIWDRPIEFRSAGGGTDTDPLEIARFQRSSDANDLQVVIGDNLGGDDRLVVGPRISGAVQPQFVVENSGTVRVAEALMVGGANAMIDVMAGDIPLNATPLGTDTMISGTYDLELTSARLPRVSKAVIMVALSDVANLSVATNAQWRVQFMPNSEIFLTPNKVRFPIKYYVSDIDGTLFRFSYVAIFLA